MSAQPLLRVGKVRPNPFFHRTDMRVQVVTDDSAPTVSRRRLKEALAGAEGARMVVDQVTHEFGRPEDTAIVKIYEDREEMMTNEPDHLLVRDGVLPSQGKGSNRAHRRVEKNKEKKNRGTHPFRRR